MWSLLVVNDDLCRHGIVSPERAAVFIPFEFDYLSVEILAKPVFRVLGYLGLTSRAAIVLAETRVRRPIHM